MCLLFASDTSKRKEYICDECTNTHDLYTVSIAHYGILFPYGYTGKTQRNISKVSTSALNNVMQTKSDSVIGIDIGTSAIKVVQIKKREGRAVLETYGAIALGPYADLPAGKVTNLDNEKLLPAITELLKASGVNTKETAFAIPSAASLIFIVEIPERLSEKEYDSVIQTEARKFIPVPIAEVTLDWWVIPERDSETSGPEGLDETTSTPTSHKKKR